MWNKPNSQVVSNHVATNALQLSGLVNTGCAAVATFIDDAMDCQHFLEAIVENKGSSPTSTAAAEEVVASLTVPGSGAGGGVTADEECVICREEVVGAGTCEMLCTHMFHSVCVQRWLKRVTCPTCWFELPTDDVFYKFGRLWRTIVSKSRSWPSLGDDGLGEILTVCDGLGEIGEDPAAARIRSGAVR